MKILVVLAHPHIDNSRINRTWKERLLKEDNVTVVDLYEFYSDKEVDVELEQKKLVEHNRIVFQFPIHWYTSPILLKKYIDSILTYGFAFGEGGDKLENKEFLLAVSTGGEEETYRAGGYNNYTMSEILRPFQAISNFVRMKFLPTFVLHGAVGKSDEQIKESAEQYVKHVNRDFSNKKY